MEGNAEDFISLSDALFWAAVWVVTLVGFALALRRYPQDED